MILKNSHKFILVTSLMMTVSFGKEISVFGAGNLDSPAPYGLNKAERAVLLNNEKVNALSSKIDALELKIGSYESKQDDLSQRIEGIKSVYESDSQNINKTKLNIKTNENKIEEQTGLLSVKIDENSKKIEDINIKLDNFISLQKKNNKLLEESNQKLLTIINKINTEYVNKSQFDELVAFINKNGVVQPIVAPKKQENTVIETVEKPKSDKKDDKDLFEDGLKLLNTNQISKAMAIFEQLVVSKYKPAESNFYLGETKFIKKEYREAIQLYKQSMIANDKADYIPRLLLHSAFSFENLKQKENAVNFYKTIVEVYPDSKEAKEAAKKLKSAEPQETVAKDKDKDKEEKKTSKKDKKDKSDKKEKVDKKSKKDKKEAETKKKSKDSKKKSSEEDKTKTKDKK